MSDKVVKGYNVNDLQQLHEKLQAAHERREGEFTVREYMEANNIETYEKAIKLLGRALKQSLIEKRMVSGTRTYWKVIEKN